MTKDYKFTAEETVTYPDGRVVLKHCTIYDGKTILDSGFVMILYPIKEESS